MDNIQKLLKDFKEIKETLIRIEILGLVWHKLEKRDKVVINRWYSIFHDEDNLYKLIKE